VYMRLHISNAASILTCSDDLLVFLVSGNIVEEGAEIVDIAGSVAFSRTVAVQRPVDL
jgi:hypothetical protein